MNLLVLCGLSLGLAAWGTPQDVEREDGEVLFADDFEKGVLGETPAGWAFSSSSDGKAIRAVDPRSQGRFDRVAVHVTSPSDGTLAELWRSFPAHDLRGRALRLRVVSRIESRDEASLIVLSMRVRDGRGTLLRDDETSMTGHPARSMEGLLELTTDVSWIGAQVEIGLGAAHAAEAWFDDVSLVVTRRLQPPTVLAPETLDALVAYFDTLGLLHSFHPAEDDSAVDWNALARSGCATLLRTPNDEVFETGLRLLHRQAPRMRILHHGTPLADDVLPAHDDSLSWVTFREHGTVGASIDPRGMTAGRISSGGHLPPRIPDPNEPVTVFWNDEWSAVVPIALHANRDGLFPHVAHPRPAFETADHAVNDLPSRLAIFAQAWNALRFFHPHRDRMGADARMQLRALLPRVAEARDERAFRDVLRELLARLGPGTWIDRAQPWSGLHPPFEFDWIEGRAVITQVAGSRGALDVGDVILTLDGMEVALDAVPSSPTLRCGTLAQREFEVRVLTKTGEERTVTIHRDRGFALAELARDVVTTRGPGLVEYDPPRFQSDDVPDAVLLAETVLIPLRRTTPSNFLSSLLPHLIEEPIPEWANVGRYVKSPRIDEETLFEEFGNTRTEPAFPTLDARIFVLLHGRPLPENEHTLRRMLEHGLVTCIGELAGFSAEPQHVLPLPGGYRITWSDAIDAWRNPSPWHPDHPVTRTIAGVREGRDEVLERALQVVAEEADPDAVLPETSATSLPNRVTTRADLARLIRKRILVWDGDTLTWHPSAKERHPVTRVTNGRNVLLETPRGTVSAKLEQLADDATVRSLPALIARLSEEDVALSTWRLHVDHLLGPHLATFTQRLTEEGLLTSVPCPKVDERSGVGEAVRQLGDAFEWSPLSPAGRAVVKAVLRFAAEDGHEHTGLTSALARRLVRNGWLTEHLGSTPEIRAIEAALRSASALHPTEAFEGPGGRLERLRNAYGEGGWVLRTSSRLRFQRELPDPVYLHGIPTLSLVVDLPPDAPDLDPRRALAARLTVEDREVARWTTDEGLQVDRTAWATVVRGALSQMSVPLATNAFPPHLLLVDLAGNPVRLITRIGWLAPPQTPDSTEMERFLEDAARCLPTIGHLDLIGEWLFDYVYDSPDPRHPRLIGIPPQWDGEHHQTPYETLATFLEGRCRGDCDDLSEVYQEIARRQGRLAHLIRVPRHLAMATTQLDEEIDLCQTFVLQTGPPFEFADPDYRESLRAAYEAFDEPYLTTSVPIALRFAGENTRSTWTLSERIFIDPVYAEIMTDVQRSLHMGLSHQVVERMEDLIARGNRDPANHLELAGIRERVGRYDLAATLALRALDASSTATEEEEADLYQRYVLDLYRAGDAQAARRAIDRRIESDGRAPSRERRASRIRLAAIAAGQDDLTTCQKILSDRVLRFGIRSDVRSVVRAARREDPSTFHTDAMRKTRESLRGLHQVLLTGILTAHEDAEAQAFREMLDDLEPWLRDVFLIDIETSVDPALRLATLGRHYEAILGTEAFQRRLAAAEPPKTTRPVLRERGPGTTELDGDLPWIKASPYTWTGALARLLDVPDGRVDVTQVTQHVVTLTDVCQQAETYGLGGPHLDPPVKAWQVVAAILTRDEPRLEHLFAEIAKTNDRTLNNVVIQMLALVARHVEPEFYRRTLTAWIHHVDHAPNYFTLAYAALVQNAPFAALLAADLAVVRHRDDEAFWKERAVLEEHVEAWRASHETSGK